MSFVTVNLYLEKKYWFFCGNEYFIQVQYSAVGEEAKKSVVEDKNME
jgi:hypothetical protein